MHLEALSSYPLPMEASALIILSLWGLNNVDLQQGTDKLQRQEVFVQVYQM